MIFFVGLIAGIFVMCLMSAAENRDLVELSDICKELLVEAKTDREEALPHRCISVWCVSSFRGMRMKVWISPCSGRCTFITQVPCTSINDQCGFEWRLSGMIDKVLRGDTEDD